MPAGTSAVGILGSKLFPPLAGLAGAIITLSYMTELTRRQWASALVIGVFGAYIITPIASAYLRHHFGAVWLPSDGSVEGLIGMMIGMAGIHVVGGFTVIGRKFSSDPVGAIVKMKGGEK